MTDRLLVIGLDVQHERIDSADFAAVAPLTDYPVVVLDPGSVSALWSHAAPGADGRLLADSDTDDGLGNRLVEVIRRRRREAAELLAAGGLLVCILRPVGTPLHVRLRVLPKGPSPREGAAILHAYSWLPGEPALTRLVIAAEQESGIFDFRLPIFDWQTKACVVVRPERGESAQSKIENRKSKISAEACVANEQLDPRWRVLATDRLGRPIALEVAVGEGRVLFVPPIVAGDAAEQGALLVAHFAPPKAPAAPSAPRATPAPGWLADCSLPRQAELATRVGHLEGEVERLQAELAGCRIRLGELIELGKLLYASNAAELAEPVAIALRRLGFEVATLDADCLDAYSRKGAEGRALVTVAASGGIIDSDPYWALLRRLDEPSKSFDSRLPISDCETRGGASASSEPEQSEIENPESKIPKGIIVGNAYCGARPGTRGVPFSDILHRGAQHREICLLSSVELHAAIVAALERPGDEALRSRLCAALLQTTGPCRLTPLLSLAEPPAQPN